MKCDRVRRWPSQAVLLSWVLFSRSAWGAGAKVLFVAPERTPFSARVRAEIAAMGLELVDTDQLDEQGHSTLSAAAYVIESPPPRRIELWLKQSDSGRLERNTVLEVEGDASSNDEVLETVRVSEQLRAFFQPFQGPAQGSGEHPAQGEPLASAAPLPTAAASHVASQVVAPMPALPAARAAGAAQFFEGLALAIPLQPGRLSAGALLRGGFWAAPRWGLGAKLVIPVLSGELRKDGNSASVSTTLIGAEVSLRVSEGPRWSALARAGFALLWLRASGTAQASYSATSDSGVAALPTLGLQLGHALSERLRLCAEGELGFALPKVEVAFANRSVATFARPWTLLSLGLQMDIQP